MVDLVNLAIEKVLSGKRQWDVCACPDFFLFLRGIVDSDLNHLAEKPENKLVMADTLPSQLTDCDDCEQEISIILMVPSDTPNPEEMLLLKEDEVRCEKFYWGFYESLADKPFLQKVVECIWDEVEKPAEIAERVNVPVGEIYNARKQLQRRLDEYRKTN